ncbi:hypothetical protein FRC04_000939 [Tulasnella sp. 424]|nr:hypothetical protein FRC04_000939 [Tulasnella sp. 424]KAG8977855.1 hypothetical protein FRC05_000383 [Tulasnella sp. 425]
MSECLFLDGVVCNAAPDKRTSEKAPAPAPAAIGDTISLCCVDSRSSISLNGRPTLPLELFIEIIEQLAVPQARTLSNPPRGTYLCDFVKYFSVSYPTDNAAADIPDIVNLIRDSVEYIHVNNRSGNSAAPGHCDSFGSVRNLRQLSISSGSVASPGIRLQGLSGLESVVLDYTNALRMVKEILAAASNGDEGVMDRNLSIYCVAPGIPTPYRVVMWVEEFCKEFIATGRNRPPFRVIMFFHETSPRPAYMWTSNLATLPDRWFGLPVPASPQRLASLEFDQWLHRSIDDGSLWEIDPIPISGWAIWLKEKSEQSVPEGSDVSFNYYYFHGPELPALLHSCVRIFGGSQLNLKASRRARITFGDRWRSSFESIIMTGA